MGDTGQRQWTEVGVYIEKDKYAQYIAHVLVANRHESVTHQAKVMAPEPTFELAAMAAREWAKDHITKIFEVKAGGPGVYAAG
ncbi:MAG TPA: hypothetical protein DIC52_00460 [Candidatus Latescibacteria bacterium]|jgi:hypothetical protein|nr:hypothetical protein [Candidatus Latescibacterota bacterium]|tara:strand:+ start:417 stop:665 length:249 start_codon:yes stop_codon:yes gene_type:complete